MKALFRKSFTRDLRKVKDPAILKRVEQKIEEVERAAQPGDIKDFKKLSGGGDYYRIRIGDYRLGIVLKQGSIEFVRCLHRRELYRYFP